MRGQQQQGQPKTVAELEALLRSTLATAFPDIQLSGRKARKLASMTWAILKVSDDEAEVDAVLKAYAALSKSI